jgi:hypothetical protein
VGQRGSGRVWTLDQVISPEVDHVTSTTSATTFTALQMWVRDGGPTLQLHTLFHFSENAGEVKAERFVFRCTLL